MTDTREALAKALAFLEEEALDSVRAEADHIHTTLRGYKPAKHAAADALVKRCESLIAECRAALSSLEADSTDTDLGRLPSGPRSTGSAPSPSVSALRAPIAGAGTDE